jgi:hypothetical protein
MVQLLACTQSNTIYSRASAELAVPTLKSHATMTPNKNATMTIHTTNSIQGSKFNVLKQEEPGIRKAILSNVDDAIFLVKGSVKCL